jgi:EAL domain-containing protein (putative c-di-GMP-specific phosphodiesterase class I)
VRSVSGSALISTSRHRYAPRIDLETGRVVAFVGSPLAAPRLDRLDRDDLDTLDRDVAEVLACARAAGTASVPVELRVNADTVAHAPQRLRAVWPAMLHGAGRGAGVTLVLRPRARSATLDALERGVARLRHDGFDLAVPVGGFGVDEIVRLRPDQLVLDEDCVSGCATGDPAALAALEVARALSGAAGARLAADGVRDEAVLRELRRHGVTAASGPILAADQDTALPAAVTLAPGLGPRLATTARGRTAPEPAPAAADPRTGPVLRDVATPATVLDAAATGEQVRDALTEDPDCAGVLLVDGAGHATGYLDRNRFLLTIAGPYGRAVYAHRPAARLAEAPRVRPCTTPVREAVREQLEGDPRRRYDDTVLAGPDGRHREVARFSDLVRALDDPGPITPPEGTPVPATVPRGRHRLVDLAPRSPDGPYAPA